MSRKFFMLLTAAVLLTGCSGGDDAILEGELPDLVLQPADLPDAFTRFDVGRLARVDMHPGPRQDPQRFGRKDGWKARFKRPGSPETAGPLVVESRVDLFASADGARKDLDAYETELHASGERIRAAPVGEASVATTFLQESQLADVRFYAIAWRHENVTAFVVVQGFDGKLELEDALALARQQERRIERAAG